MIIIRSVIKKKDDPWLKPLANTTIKLRYKDGSIREIKYPAACDKCKHDVGDYCWALALAHEDNKVEEFAKEHCPCQDI